ncbi:MAG: type II secretion system F family protein [Deltaproteobacteria bacterium]|nr:type II secretion system F family protein [Deltaproteobacteria bacterium]
MHGVKSPIMRIFIPMSIHLGSVLSSFVKIKDNDRIRSPLIRADVDDMINISDFVAFRLMMALIGSLFGLIICDSTNLLEISCFGLLGYSFPGIHLRNIAADRKKSIEAELPYLLDMLTLSVEAGMDFVQAIIRIKDRMRVGPMKDELARFDIAVKGGLRRAEALSMISNRLEIPSITSFVSVLVQADRFGTGVGLVLRAQSRRLRSERLVRAEEMGAKASQKILLPLVFFIMPTTFIVIFGPIAIRFMTGGLGALFS